MIIITDGEDHEGNATGIAEKQQEQEYRLTVGIGSPEGSPIPATEYGTNYMTDNDGNVVISD